LHFPVAVFGDIMNLNRMYTIRNCVVLRLFLTINFGPTTGSLSDGKREIPFTVSKRKSWMRIRDDPNLSAKRGEI
jgi:hypothetical protein